MIENEFSTFNKENMHVKSGRNPLEQFDECRVVRTTIASRRFSNNTITQPVNRSALIADRRIATSDLGTKAENVARRLRGGRVYSDCGTYPVLCAEEINIRKRRLLLMYVLYVDITF